MLIVTALASGGSYELSKLVTRRQRRREFLATCALSYSCFKLLMFDITEVTMFCLKRFSFKMTITA